MHELTLSKSGLYLPEEQPLYLPEDFPAAELPRQFILKTNSRCNLACDNCYMYELADQSWENQPIHMNMAVVDAASRRVGEYAERHKLSKVTFGYHGGEPLLENADYFDEACATVRENVPESTVVRFAMQTNGIRLSEDHLKVFNRWGMRVAFSLDGDREANDRHRTYRNGNSSYDQVIEKLDLIRQDAWRHLFSGILAVIDIRNDPDAVYDAIKAQCPPQVDLLLPHGNWQSPPFGLETAENRAGAPYAKWVNPLFDRWIKYDMEAFSVRTFKSILSLLAGGRSSVESFGSDVLTPELVIETNGEFQKVDTLKSTYEGAPEIGMNVFADTVDQAVARSHEQLAAVGATVLAEMCQECPVSKVCGAGYMPHRYAADGSFTHPSVYHEDLLRIIAHAKGASMEQTIVLAAQRILEPFVHRGYAY